MNDYEKFMPVIFAVVLLLGPAYMFQQWHVSDKANRSVRDMLERCIDQDGKVERAFTMNGEQQFKCTLNRDGIIWFSEMNY